MPDASDDRVRLVAIPCEPGDDLNVERSAHFGKAPAFAVVRLEGDRTAAWWVVHNARHGEPGHAYLVAMFGADGVTDVVTAGIGVGMYQRLMEAGIRVWIEQDAATASAAVRALVEGRAVPAAAHDIGKDRGD